jgi:hypothetical protein
LTFWSDFIPFFILYTPFWSVPTMGISLYFSMIYFKKGYKKTAILFFLSFALSMTFLAFFVVNGGPSRAPKEFIKATQKLF